MSRKLNLPLSVEAIRDLRAGDVVEITGSLITGRDQACARLHRLLQEGRPLPVSLQGELIYFVGPSPSPPGAVVGSAGPTTSGRMNPFLPTLLDAGLRGFMGKGFVSEEVKAALRKNGGVYFGAVGGTGALLSQSIVEAEVVAFPELLSEAIHRFRLQAFPSIVLYDSQGGDVYARVYGAGGEG